MTMVSVTTIKKDDFVTIPKTEMKGIVTRIDKYTKDIYLNILNENGQSLSYKVLVQDTINKVRKTKLLSSKFNKHLMNLYLHNIGWIGGHMGSDPEMFVVNKKTNEVIPAFNFLGSSKNPDKIKNDINEYGDGNPLFWDGFQAEFNTADTACLAWVVDSVHAGLKTLSQKAKKYDKDARLTIQPTLDIPIDMLMESKPEHVDFGCMPSLNVYGMSGFKANGRDVPFRSAGGHIHFGIVDHLKNDKTLAEKFVKDLDKVLGVACVSLFDKYDDSKRRVLYGLAGEYRLPKHGLEYRTLSCAWMAHPIIMNIVFDLSRKVIGASNSGLMKYWDATEKETIECINNCDIELARKIIDRNSKIFKAMLDSCYYDRVKVDVIYKTFMNGMGILIENPDDVEGNWLSGNYRSHSDGQGCNVKTIHNLANYQKVIDMK